MSFHLNTFVSLPWVARFMCLCSAAIPRSLIAACVLCGVSQLAAQGEVALPEELPSAVDLYNSYLEQNGGRSNLIGLNTLVASGTIKSVEGDSYLFKITRKRPDKYRLKVEFVDSTTVETISNGTQAWTVVTRANGDAKTVELLGDDLSAVLAEGNMDGAFLQLAGQSHLIHPVGFEEVRGHPAIRVEVDPAADIPYHTIWLSAEHFQEVKLAMSAVPKGGAEPVETELYLSAFEKLIGIYHATSLDYVVDGAPTKTIQIDRIRSNVGIFDRYFSRD